MAVRSPVDEKRQLSDEFQDKFLRGKNRREEILVLKQIPKVRGQKLN